MGGGGGEDASEEILCVIGALATVLFSALREPAEASLAGKTLGGTLPHWLRPFRIEHHQKKFAAELCMLRLIYLGHKCRGISPENP